MISVKSNNKFSIVSIEKWEDYQVDELKNNNKVTTEEQQSNTNKNVKNVNNNKKEKKETEYDLLINKNFTDETLKNTIYDFIKMRKAIKKSLTTKGLELLIKELNKLSNDTDTQIKILNKSIMNNWQGIFPLKENAKQKFLKEKKQVSKAEFGQREYEEGELDFLIANNLGGKER